ncbi:signal peptidase II [Siccirubricoccus sp. G192]|uniref:signal peptidase II n=1 Tax=Siccirubricoccus sp. G192 TaxID=2849651 RepID=UPI001C2C49BA|nr:signal peptidase II [Siccirubricoccus sp. G192]MBV1796222.1 signal peptidase II [Siccirubricoccus sp. G192]
MSQAAADATAPAQHGRLRLGLPAAALLLAADQASKWWVLEGLRLPELRQVPLLAAGPFGLDLTMVWNRGVTFGLFSGDGPLNHLVLALLAAAIALFLLRWMARAETRLVAVALGAVVGGAVGNVIDRLRFGAVVDFVDAHAWGWHWYVFNVADAGIVCGVGVLLADALFRRPPAGKEAA